MNNDPKLTEELQKLEESMTRPDIRHSPDLLARLLSEDFREFGSSGRVFDKSQIIDALQNQPEVQLWLDKFEARLLAPNLALVTYRGNCKLPGSDKTSHSLRSSIWLNRDGRWQVIFHQGTPSPNKSGHDVLIDAYYETPNPMQWRRCRVCLHGNCPCSNLPRDLVLDGVVAVMLEHSAAPRAAAFSSSILIVA